MKKYILYTIIFLLWGVMHGFIYLDSILNIKFHLDCDPISDAALASDYSYLILDVFEVLFIVALLTEVFLLVCISGNKYINKSYIIIIACIVFVVNIVLCFTVFYANNLQILSEMKNIIMKITYKLAGISLLDIALCCTGLWILKKREKYSLK